jgi:hypothetical protein
VQGWTVENVCTFVQGMSQAFGDQASVYTAAMTEQEIDGEALLDLSAADLEELGVSLEHRSLLGSKMTWVDVVTLLILVWSICLAVFKAGTRLQSNSLSSWLATSASIQEVTPASYNTRVAAEKTKLRLVHVALYVDACTCVSMHFVNELHRMYA